MAERVHVTYQVAKDAAHLARLAAEHFQARVAQAVEKRGLARIAVSGGNTPRQTFALLADPAGPFAKGVPWEKVELFFVDERMVCPDDPDSNFRMTRENLLSKVPIPEGSVHRVQGERDPEEAASLYESEIRRAFRLEGAEGPRFDLVWLGLGDDGHTASLFPHTEGVHEIGRIAFANHVPQKNTWRISLSAPVINAGLDVVFLVEGEAKAAPLERVLFGERDPEQTPAQLILPASGRVTFLLDPAAAAKLPAPGADGIGHTEIAR